MPGQELHVIERHALAEQVGNLRHPERVQRQPHRQTGILKPPPAHPAHVLHRQRPVSQPFGLAQRRTEQRTILILGRDSSRIKIRADMPFQIVTHQDFPALAAFLQNRTAYRAPSCWKSPSRSLATALARQTV